MRTPNENIRQILEMLDNPNAYTEQEIRNIINRDEDTREAYRLIVEAKRSSRHRKSKEAVDVDAAWKKFSRELQPKKHGLGRMKIAASFIGGVLVSSIAFAAIHIAGHHQRAEAGKGAELTANTGTPIATAPADTLVCDTATIRPIIYKNIPLGKMLPEIAAHYGAKVLFINDQARELRFRFVWNPQHGIDQVVSDLNRFEHLNITREGDQITVE